MEIVALSELKLKQSWKMPSESGLAVPILLIRDQKNRIDLAFSRV